MSQKETRLTVSLVEQQLLENYCKFYNIHGSNFSENGAPDILACMDGAFVGIECKLSDTQPFINQLRQAIYIIRSGGRYIVAKEDFNFQLLKHSQLPVFYIANEIGEGEFTEMNNAPKFTYEIKLVNAN